MKTALIILLGSLEVLAADRLREWSQGTGYRSAALKVANSAKEGFSLVQPDESGVNFTNQLSESRSLTNQIYLNGSGVAAGDVDGDGWCDLYFCGLDNQNELYRNIGGWRFERITDSARVACADQASTGAALADMDGDGDLDLVVNAIARGTRLFQNDGRGSFTEITESAGLASKSGGMSFAIGDVNNDGFLDLYVVNYRSSTFRDEREKRFRVVTRNGAYELSTVDGRPVTESDLVGRFTVDPVAGLLEHGEPDVLYLNEAGARFRPIDWRDGTFSDENGKPVSIPYDWGLSAMFRDLNDDGAPDLYVCNDFQSPDRIWLNDGRGRFRSAPARSFRQTSLFSMGVDVADLNGDEREEIFVADMLSRKHGRRQTQLMDLAPGMSPNLKVEPRPQVSRNTLFWNRGDGTYGEVAQLAGLDASEWSWSPVFIDVDLDGLRDLLVTTGHGRDAQHADIAREIEQAKKRNTSWREQMELRRRFPRLESPLLAFRNQGRLAFREATSEWGFTTSQISQGIALADLDNDGDQDVIVNCLNSGALLYRNETAKPRIAVKLRGVPPNTRGIGAEIIVKQAGLPTQRDEMIAGGRYLSSDDSTRTFAAREGERASIRVFWRSGKSTTVTNAHVNTLYEIAEESSTVVETRAPVQTRPVFEDISAHLAHKHEDQVFDDFSRQPFLPRKFSELSPGVSWFDLDGDGWEDLFVGAGRTGSLAYFKNNRGTLVHSSLSQISAASRRDQGGIIGWSHGTDRILLVAFSNYEDAGTNGPSVIAFNPNASTISSVLDAQRSSIGTLALADVDGDGDLDAFAGGRVIPGRYPEPASSTFLRNDNGSFTNDEALNGAFHAVGLVSAATWSDLTGDGRPELLLAIDGGPVRVFTFVDNRFRDLTEELGFNRYRGWWQSITTGDFNNDGRLDVVAGNLGRNNKHQRYVASGYQLFYGETPDKNGTFIVEAVRDPDSNRIVPVMDRDSLAMMFPDLPQRYPTLASFSSADVSEILGKSVAFKALEVNTADSIVFFNQGSGPPFRAEPLPLEGQFAPAFGLAVGDVNADGNEDLVLTQNLFSVGKRTSRYDAGEGLLFLGDGEGGLSPVAANVSGIRMDGEGRGAAFCDFDHDGRLDLAAGQNSGETKLYWNRSERAGLRVVLRAGSLNPDGIGAQVRIRYSDGTAGPLHEVRAGEGYWSQAAATIVLGQARSPRAVEVLWPDGERQVEDIPGGATAINSQKRKTR